jgi:CLIP-associating protein 1/2
MSPDSTRPPVMAQKMLQKSREAESALADALTFDSIENYGRISGGKGDHSDDSENSSICSERSMDGFRRASDVSTCSITCQEIKQ